MIITGDLISFFFGRVNQLFNLLRSLLLSGSVWLVRRTGVSRRLVRFVTSGGGGLVGLISTRGFVVINLLGLRRSDGLVALSRGLFFALRTVDNVLVGGVDLLLVGGRG